MCPPNTHHLPFKTARRSLTNRRFLIEEMAFLKLYLRPSSHRPHLHSRCLSQRSPLLPQLLLTKNKPTLTRSAPNPGPHSPPEGSNARRPPPRCHGRGGLYLPPPTAAVRGSARPPPVCGTARGGGGGAWREGVSPRFPPRHRYPPPAVPFPASRRHVAGRRPPFTAAPPTP